MLWAPVTWGMPSPTPTLHRHVPSLGCLCTGRVLDLFEAGLEGAIPKSLSDLTALTYLDLGYNPSITKLPYFGNLKKLE
jgi:hypothetical protein